MEADFGRVAIVGLGLMGGSMAAAISEKAPRCHVIGIARRASTVARARMLRFVDEGTQDLANGVRDADIVVLATPVRDILDKIANIGPLLKPGCLLMDVGSTKKTICEAMSRVPEHVQVIGGHPMCGKESSGLTMAEPDLYQDRVYVLAPLPRTSEEALDKAIRFVRSLGARPLILDPERHDRMVAAISHLPYMLSVTLVSGAEDFVGYDELTWQLAAGGFRDTSRVAGGSLPMMLDILATNREPILEALDHAQNSLSRLIQLLQGNDMQGMEEELSKARTRRREVFP